MQKTLGLGMIIKNESRHLARLAKNIEGLFDQWVIVDTGSTDGSVELAKSLGAEVHHFTWIEDFAAARNEVSKYMKTDYVCWLDGDDSIKDPEALLEWKKTAMPLAELWLANYNYALHPDGRSACTFVRERVYRNDPKFTWRGFTHEGLDSNPLPSSTLFTGAWAINHLRTPEDLAADKGRNVGIFDRKKAQGVEFDSRALYYYGKELFEAGRIDDGFKYLMQANCKTDLQLHDRTLCIQYAVYILLHKGEYVQAINLAMSGLLLNPQRAEFYVLIGDCYIKMNRFKDAIPYYEAAKGCEPLPETGFGGFIFQNRTAYTDYPRNQLARIYAQLGQFERGAEEAKKAFDLYQNEESKAVFIACQDVATKSIQYKSAVPDEAVVFTCPGGLYEWDSKVYKERGIGGSETACVEMASWMRKLTKRPVKVFNQREKPFIDEDGVEYLPLDQMHPYFAEHKPKLNVNWRHNFKMSEARTLVWSHDLIVPGGEKTKDYDKFLCLSPFHSKYVQTMLQIPEDKIFVTRNGIDPTKFKPIDHSIKDPFKVIYVSSPDRGLERVIDVCEMARATYPEITLHVYYGTSNLRKMNKIKEAEYFEELCKKPWIKLHGNIPQNELMEEYKTASVWLYCTNFLETFAISALETVLSGVYPLVRNYGALPFTLATFIEKGMATCLDLDAETFEDKIKWADELCRVIQEKRWETIKADPQKHSWENLAKEWIKDFLI